MALFLIAGMPAFLILLLNVFFTDTFDRRSTLGAFGRGLVWFFPALIVFTLVTGDMRVHYGGFLLFLTRTWIDLFLPLALGLAVYIFSYRADLIVSGKEQFVRSAAFLCGFFTLFSQYRLIVFNGWYEGYIYFILPLCWMILVVVGGLLLGLFFSVIGGVRFLFPLIGTGMVFLLGTVSYLYLLNFVVYAWLLTAAFFLATAAALRRARGAIK